MQIAVMYPDNTLVYEALAETDHEQLAQFQRIVGGNIQVVPIEFNGCDAFVNEDGIELGLSRNSAAEEALRWPAALLGPVIVTGGLRGEVDTGLNEHQHEALADAADPRSVAVAMFNEVDYDLSEENLRGAWD